MKSAMKGFLVLAIAVMVFTGCDLSMAQDPVEPKIPTPGVSANATISVDSSSQDYANGNDDNFYYTFWKDKEEKGGFPANQGTASMQTWKYGNGYGFWAFWNNVHGIVGGRGWSTGKVNLSLTFHGWVYSNADQNGVDDDGYFGVYGWADNNWSSGNPSRLIEYYVIEQHGTKGHGLDNDGDQGSVGSTRSIDGSNYTAYKTRRVNKPSIKGWTDFDQYWSVRADQRQSGTMTFASHVDLWRRSGWTQLSDSMMNKDGTYQILFVEAPFDANTGTGNGFGFIDGFSGR